MHARFTHRYLLGLCLVASAFGCGQSLDLAPAQQAAAREWLALTDAGDYSASWRKASTIFRAAVTEADWVQQVCRARAPLGPTKSREQRQAVGQTDPMGAPDGAYVVVTYATSFAKKAETTETLTLYQEDDGAWQVAGYYIN